MDTLMLVLEINMCDFKMRKLVKKKHFEYKESKISLKKAFKTFPVQLLRFSQ